MGLEPMTSPLPRECSTTELHQPACCRNDHSGSQSHPITALPAYRVSLLFALTRPIRTRNAKKPNNTQTRDLYFPGSIVRHTPSAAKAITASATNIRCCDPGPSMVLPPGRTKNGAQGRIRTSVTLSVADLQSAAINHSATCAHSPLLPCKAPAQPFSTRADTATGKYLMLGGRPCRNANAVLPNPSACMGRNWSWRRDLNPRPSDYKSDALPAELRQPKQTFALPVWRSAYLEDYHKISVRLSTANPDSPSPFSQFKLL